MSENIQLTDTKNNEYVGLTFPEIMGVWNLSFPAFETVGTKKSELPPFDKYLEHKTSDTISPFHKKNIITSVGPRGSKETLKLLDIKISDIFSSRKIQLENESIFSSINFIHDNLLNFEVSTPIVIPQEGFTREEFKKNPITETILKLNKRFVMTDTNVIGDFLVDLKQMNPSILTESELVANEVHDFFEEQKIEYYGLIETEYDSEDEERKNLRFVIEVENQDVEACLELSKNLITKIAEKNKSFLRNININIVSK